MKAIFTLFFSTVLFVFTPNQHAAPGVNWEPSAIQIEIELGDIVTNAVSFTSASDYSKLEVNVVPELRPYVQVSPEEFSDVVMGEAYSINVTASLPEVEFLGAIEGVIQLRNGKKNVSVPLPVELTLGVPYESDQYGYLLHLPNYPDVNESESINPGVLSTEVFTGMLNSDGVVVKVFDNSALLEVQDWYDQFRSDNEYTVEDSAFRTSNETSVAGVSALEVISDIMGTLMLRVYVPHGDIVIEFSTWYGDSQADQSTFYQVLNSLVLL